MNDKTSEQIRICHLIAERVLEVLDDNIDFASSDVHGAVVVSLDVLCICQIALIDRMAAACQLVSSDESCS